MNTSQRMPSFSLGKSGTNICGSKVSQSTLMRDCKTGQHPLASACHRLTLYVKSKPSGSSSLGLVSRGNCAHLTNNLGRSKAFLPQGFHHQGHPRCREPNKQGVNRTATEVGQVVISQFPVAGMSAVYHSLDCIEYSYQHSVCVSISMTSATGGYDTVSQLYLRFLGL